ncbi:hypothetical protein HOLleu_05479 [Holothuria leucospilota]|uniref:Kazal-like domain-containing protein n=1 Tax=Holothuria leucospilota TaxID=206669 RepID=A0A9Q1CJP0_HOLLE|nr:hypothetical protein HOLleu_05479 [Holothuria leucospilota]
MERRSAEQPRIISGAQNNPGALRTTYFTALHKAGNTCKNVITDNLITGSGNSISMRFRWYVTIFVCVITLIVSVTLIVVLQSNKVEEGEAGETINSPEGGGRVFTTRRATTFNVEDNITTGLVNDDITTVTPGTSDALDVSAQAPLNMTGNSSVPSDGTTIPVRRTGTAKSGTTQPFAVDCPNLCPILRQLVCGTDGTTYQSPCVLQLVACVNNDPTLMVASLGPCPVSTLEPISAL